MPSGARTDDPLAGAAPFELEAVVDHYEDWYASPFGVLADGLELDFLLDLLAPIEPGARLLEIGCGTAHFGAALRARGYSVVGTDLSTAMLAPARARVPVARASAEHQPFATDSFDACYLVALLDFVPDPVAVLAEARRVARDRVVVIALAGNSWLAWRRRLAARLGNPIFSAARFWSRRRLRAFVRAAGGEIRAERAGLCLPPWLGARLPALERRLARGCPPGAGLYAFAFD